MKIFKDFENIKEGREVEVILKNIDKPVNGKVVENNLKQLYLRINETTTDTMIRYEQITSVEVFEGGR
jgi:hypothetical protein